MSQSKSKASEAVTGYVPFYLLFGESCQLKKKIPKPYLIILYVIWKLQMLSLPLRIASLYLEEMNALLTQFFASLSSVFLYSELFAFGVDDSLKIIAFIIIQAYTWLTFLLAFCIMFILIKRRRISPPIQNIWSMLSILHIYCFSFSNINFNLRIIKHWEDGTLNLFGNGSSSGIIGILSISSLIWNFFWTFLVVVLYSLTIKINDRLASKTRSHGIIDFFTKIILIIILIFSVDNNSKTLSLVVINLVLSGLKLYQNYDTLPFYKTIFMKLEVIFSSITAALTLLNFIGGLTLGNFEFFPKKFIFVSWVFYIPFIIFSALKYLNKLMNSCKIQPKIKNRYYLLNHIQTIKSELSARIPISQKKKLVNMELLSSKGFASNVMLKDPKTGQPIEFSFDASSHFTNYTKAFWHFSLGQYPGFLPLKLAYYQNIIKYQKNYLAAVNYLYDMRKKNNGIIAHIVINIFEKDLQKLMMKNADLIDEKAKVNIKKFVKINEYHNKLKAEIKEQVDIQMKFWKEFLENDANFKTLFNFSRSIEKKKKKIRQLWMATDSFNNKTSISSYIVWAAYLDNINNLPTESSKLAKQSVFEKFRNNHSNELTNETIHLPGAYQFVVSGRKDKLGKILYCSPSFINKFGFNSRDIIDNHITSIMPNVYREPHDIVMKSSFNSSKQFCLGKSREVLIKTPENYIISMLFHGQISPYIEQGLTFIGIMREAEEVKETIIIKPSGVVDGITKQLANTLGIAPGDSVFMEDMCPEFRILLQVFSNKASEKINGNEDDAPIYVDFEQEVKDKNSSQRSKMSIFDLDAQSSISPRENLINKSTTRVNERGSKLGLRFNGSVRINNSEHLQTMMIIDSEEAEKIYEEYVTDFTYLSFYSKKRIPMKGRVKVFIETVHQEWHLILKVKDMSRLDDAEPNSQTPKINENFENTALHSYIYKDANMTGRNMISSIGLMETERLTSHYYSQSAIQEESDNSSKGYESILDENNRQRLDEYVFIEMDLPEDEEAQGNEKDDLNVSKSALDIKEKPTLLNKKSDLLVIERYNTGQRSITISKQKSLSQDFEDEEIHQNKNKGQNALTNKKNLKLFENPQSSIGTSKSTGKRNNRVLENAVDFTYIPPKYTIFFWVFILIIGVVESLIAGVGIFINSSLAELESKGNIVITAYKRTDSLNFVIVASRFINQGLNGRVGNATTSTALFPEFVQLLGEYLPKLDESNKELQSSISTIDQNLQVEFYNTQVVFYDVDLNGILPSNKSFDTFQAIHKIYSLAFPVYQTPYDNSNKRKNRYQLSSSKQLGTDSCRV